MVKKTKRKTSRLTAVERRAIQDSELHQAKEAGYQQGLKDGIKQEQQSLLRESLKVRLELGRSYATVFEAIARSAVMLFDNGAGFLK